MSFIANVGVNKKDCAEKQMEELHGSGEDELKKRTAAGLDSAEIRGMTCRQSTP